MGTTAVVSHACTAMHTAMFERRHANVMMLGLDAAGKTTVLYQLKLGKAFTTIPTIGFNKEEVDHKNMTLRIFDVGGRTRRQMWRHYYRETDAVIFVIDASDAQRLDNAAWVLANLVADLDKKNTKDAPVLVLANKQDLPSAASSKDVAAKLGLSQMRREWHVQATCATKGDGLEDGLDWLCRTIEDNMHR